MPIGNCIQECIVFLRSLFSNVSYKISSAIFDLVQDVKSTFGLG